MKLQFPANTLMSSFDYCSYKRISKIQECLRNTKFNADCLLIIIGKLLCNQLLNLGPTFPLKGKFYEFECKGIKSS